MIELSLEAGYPLSSLKERIYTSKVGTTPRHGLILPPFDRTLRRLRFGLR